MWRKVFVICQPLQSRECILDTGTKIHLGSFEGESHFVSSTCLCHHHFDQNLIYIHQKKVSSRIAFIAVPHSSFYVSGGGTAVCLILSWQDCHTQISSQTKFPPISPQISSISSKFMKISPAHGNTLLRKAFNSWCFSRDGEILRRGVYTRMLWAFQNLMGHQIKLYKLPQPYFLFPSKNNNLSPIHKYQ